MGDSRQFLRSMSPFAFLLLIVFQASLNADSFSDGEALFMQNKPALAIPPLEQALRERPDEEKAYLYLGICYQQLKRFDEAVAILRRGLPRSSSLAHLFYFNLGNCYFSQGKSAFAKDMYEQAIKARPDFGSAYLNRANALMNLKEYQAAVVDYASYLGLVPDSSQRPEIEKVVAILKKSQAEIEQAKALEEARRAEEEARRLKLLDDVAASLRDAAAETQSMSAGAEGAQGYSDESALAD